MTSPKSSPSNSPDHPDLPVKPPLVFLTTMAIGFAVHWIRPVSARPAGWWWLGAVFAALGGTLILWALVLFRRHDTEVRPWLPTRVIVSSGPYAWSRNPIYLGFSLIQLGVGLWTDRLAVVLMVLPAVAAMNLLVIGREETYLEGKFGDAYLAYMRRVRRW